MPIRIFAAILAFSLLAMSVVGAFIVWQRDFVEEKDALMEIEALAKDSGAKADPGLSRFEKAMNLVREGDRRGARDVLYDLVRIYKDSSRFGEAKRVIGEINLDLLLSDEAFPGKKPYIVQRGDSLGAIARREKGTIDYLMRANGLFDSRLHPGDKIMVCPLEFSVVIKRADLRLTLLRKGRFFKEYPVSRVDLPPGTPSSFETTVKSKSSWAGGKTLLTTDPRYVGGEKWVQLARRGVVMLQEQPPVAVVEGQAASPEQDTQPGIFLGREDVEELYSILTTGTPVTVLR